MRKYFFRLITIFTVLIISLTYGEDIYVTEEDSWVDGELTYDNVIIKNGVTLTVGGTCDLTVNESLWLGGKMLIENEVVNTSGHLRLYNGAVGDINAIRDTVQCPESSVRFMNNPNVTIDLLELVNSINKVEIFATGAAIISIGLVNCQDVVITTSSSPSFTSSLMAQELDITSGTTNFSGVVTVGELDISGGTTNFDGNVIIGGTCSISNGTNTYGDDNEDVFTIEGTCDATISGGTNRFQDIEVKEDANLTVSGGSNRFGYLANTGLNVTDGQTVTISNNSDWFGDILVDDGATFTIDEGRTIWLWQDITVEDDNSVFEISSDATLNILSDQADIIVRSEALFEAVGTVGHNATITSTDNNTWGIHLDGTDGTNANPAEGYFEYCDIDEVDGDVIQLTNGHLRMANCSIGSNCTGDGIQAINHANLDNEIYLSQTSVVTGVSLTDIDHSNDNDDNDPAGGYGFGIFNCEFYGSGGNGMTIENDGVVNFMIRNCYFYNNDEHGLSADAATGSDLKIYNNAFFDNGQDDGVDNCAGMHLEVVDTNNDPVTEIYHNISWANDEHGFSFNMAEDADYDDDVAFLNNVIGENVGTEFRITNHGANTPTFTYTCFRSTNSADIMANYNTGANVYRHYTGGGGDGTVIIGDNTPDNTGWDFRPRWSDLDDKPDQINHGTNVTGANPRGVSVNIGPFGGGHGDYGLTVVVMPLHLMS
jgi:hypothetical protein